MDTKTYQILRATVFVFVYSVLFSLGMAQGFTEQQIPSALGSAVSAQVLIGRNNVPHVFGLGDQITNIIFEEIYGRNVLFHVQRNAPGFSTPVAVPDTSGYLLGPMWGEHSQILADAALDTADSPFMVWSNQREYLSDILPHRLTRPVVKCYRRISNAWSFIFSEQGAREPRIVVGSNNAQHFAWESVTSTSRDTNYFFYKSKIEYRYRSPDGVLTIPQAIDTGYAPKLFVEQSGRPHLVWLRADSSTSTVFQLKYTRGVGGAFSVPVVLWQTIPAGRGFSMYYPRPEIAFAVDSTGGVHVAWGEDRTYPNARFFSLTYKNNIVTVDSSALYVSYGRHVGFAFETNGTAHAAWSVDAGLENDLYYSNSTSGALFSAVRTFNSMTYVSTIHLFVSQNRMAHALFSDSNGLRLLRNLQSGPDSSYEFVPNGRLPYTPRNAAAIDANDRIWTAYEKHQPGTSQYEMWLLKFDRPLSVEPEEPKPSGFFLSQNYPNPFNPSTEIRYQIPEVGSQRSGVSRVTLKVYDLLGREVATLVDDVQGAGFKTATLSAAGLASGVYFYRLKAGDFHATKKLIIVR